MRFPKLNLWLALGFPILLILLVYLFIDDGIYTFLTRGKFSERNYLLSALTYQDAEVNSVATEVITRARSKGFKLRTPIIRKTRALVGPLGWREGWSTRIFYAVANRNSRAIIIDSHQVNSSTFDHQCLKILLAHEIGHIIDFESSRKGHPLLNNYKDISNENFANLIVVYLYSKEELIFQDIGCAIAYDYLFISGLKEVEMMR